MRPTPVFRTLTSLIILVSTAAVTGAQKPPPIVENGFDGSLRRPPELVLQATAGVEGPEEGMIMRPLAMLVSAAGDLYVSDMLAHAVLVYGPDGKFKRRIGKEGSGPGEMITPAGISFAWNNELVVPDPRNGRTNYFSLAGEFLRSEGNNTGGVILVTGQVGRIRTVRGQYLRNGPIVLPFVVQGGNGPMGGKDSKLAEIVDEKGDVIRAFGDRLPNEDAQIANMINRVELDWHPSGKVLVAFQLTNELHVYDAATGTLERIIRRRTAFTPREPKMDMQQERSPDGQDVRVALRPVVDPITLAAAFDPQGRIWALTRVIGAEESDKKEEAGDYTGMVRLEVYDTDGKLLAGIPLDESADRMVFAPDGSLWLLDAQYTASARHYTIRWP
jgi:hypothetical protein